MKRARQQKASSPKSLWETRNIPKQVIVRPQEKRAGEGQDTEGRTTRNPYVK